MQRRYECSVGFTRKKFFGIIKKAVRNPLRFPSYGVKGVNGMNDSEIIRLLQARDERALAVIKEQYGALCTQIALQILGSSEDAEECLSDGLFKIWNSIPPAEPEYLKAYLAAAVRNAALDRLDAQCAAKRGGTQIPLVLDELAEVTADAQDVEADAELHQLWEAIRSFLEKQPRRQQKLFMQRYYYMMPLGEIAVNNGLSENSVTVTLHRLRKKLHEALRKEQYL